MHILARHWYRLSSSFWFIPGGIVVAAVLLALFAVEADSRFVTDALAGRWPRLLGAGAGGSRALLTAVAGSMITVAGTVFSITLVALSLASSQYSPRVLRNFMRDRANQVVLGIFVGIFAYCLVVLRSIHENDETSFVPPVAVLFGLLLGFGGIGVLVFFIHHIASSIQASRILEAVRVETCEAIDRLFPDDLDAGSTEESAGPSRFPHVVARAASSGYVQLVDHARLRAVACGHGVELEVHACVGGYVIEGDVMLSGSKPLPPSACAEISHGWTIGTQRTLEQDVGFGIRQLVDVALRALSPGINDTTTAVMCIDTLTAVLARVATRRLRFEGCDDAGRVRVHTRHPCFADLLDESFDQIRHSAADNIAVLDRVCGSLRRLQTRVEHPRRRAALRRHGNRLEETARRLHEPRDRERLLRDVAELADPDVHPE